MSTTTDKFDDVRDSKVVDDVRGTRDAAPRRLRVRTRDARLIKC